MYKKLFKFMVLVTGILFANLITMWIDNYLMSFKVKFSPQTFTWLGMAIIVVIYYPLFTHTDKWATRAGDRFIRAGKKVVGKEIGTIFAFIAALLIMFYLYGREWFHTNVFSAFLNSLKSLF